MNSNSKQERYDKIYLTVAHVFSQLSFDDDIKVGSIIVRNGQVLSQGFNGMPTGMCNHTRHSDGMTRPEVIHSEANALMKLAKTGGSSEGATIYTTHSPCIECAKLILQAGIIRVVYDETYDSYALQFLKERGLDVKTYRSGNQLPLRESGWDKYKQS
tara:strand:+ start:291 stop:764 length:474 start_codon:yes stop_codon:yes gene_type:complete